MEQVFFYVVFGLVFLAVSCGFFAYSSQDTMALVAGCFGTWGGIFMLVSRAIYKAERQAQ